VYHIGEKEVKEQTPKQLVKSGNNNFKGKKKRFIIAAHARALRSKGKHSERRSGEDNRAEETQKKAASNKKKN
jgi:hypothetical protein